MGRKEVIIKALVTGGGGFLGRYIVEQLLAQGETVTIFARGAYPELGQMGVELIRGDLGDIQAISQACLRMDVVFHVAARPGIWGSWRSFYEPNVTGTKNVIAACQANGVPKLIYTSSPSVVFNNRSQAGCDESVPYPTRYESFYAQTKSMAEQMVRKANGQKDLLTVSLRPHLIWGPRDPYILPGIIERGRSGKLIQVGDGANLVDLTYVEDAARAHLLAAEALQPGSALGGSVYFISQDDPVNLWDWVNNLLKELDIPPVQGRLPLPIARVIGGALELAYRALGRKSEPRLTRFLASGLALDHYYDISRAKQDFGYQPQVTMTEGLRRTLEFLKSKQYHPTFPES